MEYVVKLRAESESSREVLGLPFAASSRPMWVFDKTTHFFLDVNNAAVERYGYSRREFLTMTILDIRPNAEIPALLRKGPNSRPRGPSSAETWNHQSKNGEIFEVAITSWELKFRGVAAELVLATSSI